jgi:hypothetical protein
VNCRAAQASLPLAAFGALGRGPARAAERHLVSCPECRAEAERWRRLRSAITPAIAFPRETEFDWRVPVTCWSARRDMSAQPRAGESGAGPELKAHLDRCASCAAAAAGIGDLLSATWDIAFPDEARVDWEAFARQTAELARRDARPRFPRSLRLALPLAASLVAASFLGYLSWRSPAPVLPGPGDGPAASAALPIVPGDMVARTEIELARLDATRYLEDSRSLLMSVSQLAVPCQRDQIDVGAERELSTRLLRRKQYLEHDLRDVELSRVERLADEIGGLLTEIASLETCASPARLAEIRDLIRQRQLMMRIELLTNELETSGGSLV